MGDGSVFKRENLRLPPPNPLNSYRVASQHTRLDVGWVTQGILKDLEPNGVFVYVGDIRLSHLDENTVRQLVLVVDFRRQAFPQETWSMTTRLWPVLYPF